MGKFPSLFKVVALTFMCAFTIIFISCKNEVMNPDSVNTGREYNPIETGLFWVYNVTQTEYFLNEPTVNRSYQIKEVIGTSGITEGGEPFFRVLRYQRPNGFENWSLDSIWTIRNVKNEIVKIEHDVAFVKMRFPLENGKRWDGNLYNALPKKNFRVNNYEEPYTMSGVTYPETVVVHTSEDSSLVSKDVQREVFAKGVGMIYKYRDYIIYCNDPETDCFGRLITERGIYSELRLIEYGKED